jgi:hypothetical protein
MSILITFGPGPAPQQILGPPARPLLIFARRALPIGPTLPLLRRPQGAGATVRPARRDGRHVRAPGSTGMQSGTAVLPMAASRVAHWYGRRRPVHPPTPGAIYERAFVTRVSGSSAGTANHLFDVVLPDASPNAFAGGLIHCRGVARRFQQAPAGEPFRWRTRDGPQAPSRLATDYDPLSPGDSSATSFSFSAAAATSGFSKPFFRQSISMISLNFAIFWLSIRSRFSTSPAR